MTHMDDRLSHDPVRPPRTVAAGILRPVAPFWIVVACLALVPPALAGAYARLQYNETLAEATLDLTRTSRLSAGWIEYSLQTIRQLNKDVAVWMRDEGSIRVEDLRYYAGDPNLISTLRMRSHALSRVSGMFVIDRDGNTIARSDKTTGPTDPAAVRGLVTALESRESAVDVPTAGAAAGHFWAGYRLDDVDGGLSGAVVAVVETGWMEAIFGNVDAGARLAFALDRADARPGFGRIAEWGGSVSGDGVISHRISLDRFGVAITAGVERETVLASWRLETTWVALLVALWEMVLGTGTGLALRQQTAAARALAAKRAAEDAARAAAEEAQTARRRAEERAFAAIFDNTSVGFAEITLPEYRFVRVNQRYCELSGRSAEELLGRLGPSDLFFTEDLPTLLKTGTALCEDGRAETTTRYRRPDGSPIWVHVGIKVAAVHPDGKPARVVAVVQDISDLKRATDEVQAREKLLRLSMQIGHAAVFSTSPARNEIDLSEEACEIFGLPPTSRVVPCGTLIRHVAADDRCRIQAEIAAATAAREPERTYALRFVRPSDGVVRLIEARVRYDYGDDGSHSAIGMAIDVTESRESEALFRLSLSIGRIGTFRHDFVTGLVDCDPTARALYGLPLDGLPVPQDVWFGVIVDEDREALKAGLAHDVANGVVEMSRDFRIRRADDGQYRHFNTRVNLDYAADGVVVRATGVIIDLTDRHEAEARIAHLARHDVLTGLANRMVLRERTDAAVAALRRGQPFALLMIDLDHFKSVNDTLGHPTGDALLQAVTGRLTKAVRETDLVARLGGDEFAVLMAPMDDVPIGATRVADRIVQRLAEPFPIGDTQVVIGSSIGIAIADDPALDTDEVFKAADLALYRAKAEGRNRWRIFSPEMDADVRRRRFAELDLRRAVVEDEFELVYQPVIDIRSGDTVAVEAQLRWQHPERGAIDEADFLDLAEEIGVMPVLGARMLSRACVDAAAWQGTPRLAIGATSSQLADRGFVGTVEDALRRSGLAPARLEIEIDESSLTQGKRDLTGVVDTLSELGVRLCIEGLGSGQSMLGLISKYPFDQIKLDHRVVDELADPVNSAIVRAVSGLCNGLSLGCSVGGVETEQQLDVLLEEGFQAAYGHLFSRPLIGLELAAFLAEKKEPPRRIAGA